MLGCEPLGDLTFVCRKRKLVSESLGQRDNLTWEGKDSSLRDIGESTWMLRQWHKLLLLRGRMAECCQVQAWERGGVQNKRKDPSGEYRLSPLLEWHPVKPTVDWK